VPPNGSRINRRRDAQDYRAGKVRLKSTGNSRPDATPGKCTPQRGATQAPDDLDRGAVGGRLHAVVGRL